MRCGAVDEVTDFKRPAPIPNPNEVGTVEDKLVADPMSEAMENLLNGTAQRNRAIFAELFKTVPSDAVRNFEQYKVWILVRFMTNTDENLELCPQVDGMPPRSWAVARASEEEAI